MNKSNSLYLIPVVFTGKMLPIQYRTIYKKRDMRTKFCKENEKYIVDQAKLNQSVRKVGARISGNKVIICNGNMAYRFQKALYK